jgi:hypothetical protein
LSPVPGFVEANNKAVTDKLVVSNALPLRDILESDLRLSTAGQGAQKNDRS